MSPDSQLKLAPVSKFKGIFESFLTELENGFLNKFEYEITAINYDDFLSHAEYYYSKEKKSESSVIASAVFEDSLNKVCVKNGIDTEGKTLDPLISDLVKEGIISNTRAKQYRYFTDIRNHSLHAKWEKFELKNVGDLIKGTQELIRESLDA